jgi:hypothetical protein
VCVWVCVCSTAASSASYETQPTGGSACTCQVIEADDEEEAVPVVA